MDSRFLKDVDFLIVSGGGQLDDFWGGAWGHPYALLKWSVLARLRGAKPIFLSVGFGELDSRLSRLFTRTALRLAAYRSYRDPDLAISCNAPAFAGMIPYLPGPRVQSSVWIATGLSSRSALVVASVVGLSPFCYCDPRIWPRKDASQPTTLTSEISARS